MSIEINNSKDAAIMSGKWSNPGAKLYDTIMKEWSGNWRELLDEAYLEVGSDLNNDPHRGRTPFSRSGCKYPHHVVRAGKLVVSIPGLKAAYSRAKQMGVFKGKIREHLEKHYKQLGLYKDSTMEDDDKMQENFEFIENTINKSLGTNLHEEDYRALNVQDLLDEIDDQYLSESKADDVDSITGLDLGNIKREYNKIYKHLRTEEEKEWMGDNFGRESSRLEAALDRAHKNPSPKNIRDCKQIYQSLIEILDNNRPYAIKEAENWIDQFVNDDEFRESVTMENPNGYLIDTIDVFNEGHPTRLKYDFRFGWDINTGHQIKVVYSLEGIKVNGSSDFYWNNEDIRPDPKATDYRPTSNFPTASAYHKWIEENIRKYGNPDHRSSGQVVLAIVDLVTGERLNSVELVGPNLHYPGNEDVHAIDNTKMVQDPERMKEIRKIVKDNPSLVTTLTVGTKDSIDSFKSTYWRTNTKNSFDKNDPVDYRWSQLKRISNLPSGRGAAMNNIAPEGIRVTGTPSYIKGAEFKKFINPTQDQAIFMLNKIQLDIKHRLRDINMHKEYREKAPLVQKLRQYLVDIEKDINYLSSIKSWNVAENRPIVDKWVNLHIEESAIDFESFGIPEPSAEPIAESNLGDRLAELRPYTERAVDTLALFIYEGYIPEGWTEMHVLTKWRELNEQVHEIDEDLEYINKNGVDEYILSKYQALESEFENVYNTERIYESTDPDYFISRMTVPSGGKVTYRASAANNADNYDTEFVSLSGNNISMVMENLSSDSKQYNFYFDTVFDELINEYYTINDDEFRERVIDRSSIDFESFATPDQVAEPVIEDCNEYIGERSLSKEFRFVIGENDGHLYKIVYDMNPANVIANNIDTDRGAEKLRQNITNTGATNYVSTGNRVIAIVDMMNGRRVQSISAYPPIHNSGGSIMPVTIDRYLSFMARFLDKKDLENERERLTREYPRGIVPNPGYEEAIADSKRKGQLPIVYTVGEVDNTSTYKSTDPKHTMKSMFGIEASAADRINGAAMINEASHGDLRYDFRLGWDYDTGHQIKVVYSLDNIEINDVGTHALRQHNSRTPKEHRDYYPPREYTDHDSYLDWVKNNIRKKGQNDHESSGQKVLAIVDMVTGERLSSINLLSPLTPGLDTSQMTQSPANVRRAREAVMLNNSLVSNLTVGEIDTTPSFKATFWGKHVKDPDDPNRDLRWQKIQRIEDYQYGRGQKMEKIHPEGMHIFRTPSTESPDGRPGFKIFDNPNKDELIFMLEKIKAGYDNQISWKTNPPEVKRKYKELSRAIQDDIDDVERNGVSNRVIVRWLTDPHHVKPKTTLADLYAIDEAASTATDAPVIFGNREYATKDELLAMLEARKDYATEGALSVLGNNDLISLEKYRRYRRQLVAIDEDCNKIENGTASVDSTYNKWRSVESDEYHDRCGEDASKYQHMIGDSYIYRAPKEIDALFEKEFEEAAGGDVSPCIDEYVSLLGTDEYYTTDYFESKVDERRFGGNSADLLDLILEADDEQPDSDEETKEEEDKPKEDKSDDDPPPLDDDTDLMDAPLEDDESEEEQPEEEKKPEPEKPKVSIHPESMPNQTDRMEVDKNGRRRKNLYVSFITYAKDYNNKNAFGSVFDKDAFNVTYPFVPEEMRYFYRLSNPLICVLAGDLTFFPLSELRKVNSQNTKLTEMMIFAATPKDLRIFSKKDKQVYLGEEDENHQIILTKVLGKTFDTYLQNMIKQGDYLNGPDVDLTKDEDAMRHAPTTADTEEDTE